MLVYKIDKPPDLNSNKADGEPVTNSREEKEFEYPKTMQKINDPS